MAISSRRETYLGKKGIWYIEHQVLELDTGGYS